METEGDGGGRSPDVVSPPHPGAIICALYRRRAAGSRGYRLPVGEPRCLRCVWRESIVLRRALVTALVVGTILTAINHGIVCWPGG